MGFVRSWVKKHNIKCSGAVNIGVPTGEEVNDYLALKWRATWIEANPKHYPTIKDIAKRHKGHYAICAGAGAEDGEMMFNIASNDYSSSFLPLGVRCKQLHPTVHYTKQVKVPVKRLDKIFAKKDPPWDFLYMDAQGSEGRILQGCENWMPEIKAIYLEFLDSELYVGCWLTPQITKYLEGRGFHMVEKVYHYPEWGDMLFVR